MVVKDGWLDMYRDGRRLNRVLKKLDKKIKLCDDTDELIKIANSIAYVTEKKKKLIDSCLGVNDLLKKGKILEEKDWR